MLKFVTSFARALSATMIVGGMLIYGVAVYADGPGTKGETLECDNGCAASKPSCDTGCTALSECSTQNYVCTRDGMDDCKCVKFDSP